MGTFIENAVAFFREGGGESHSENRGAGFIPVNFLKFCCKLVSFLNTFTTFLAFENFTFDTVLNVVIYIQVYVLIAILIRAS